MYTISPQRIGTGVGYFIGGLVALLPGLFAAAAAAAGADSTARATATLLLPLAFGLFAVGFWVSLFGRLERRLMDIQEQQMSLRPAQPPQNPSP